MQGQSPISIGGQISNGGVKRGEDLTLFGLDLSEYPLTHHILKLFVAQAFPSGLGSRNQKILE